jgi:hypothetical protein
MIVRCGVYSPLGCVVLVRAGRSSHGTCESGPLTSLVENKRGCLGKSASDLCISQHQAELVSDEMSSLRIL